MNYEFFVLLITTFPQNFPFVLYKSLCFCLQKDIKTKKLSTMSVDGVCDLLVCLTGIKSSQLSRYQDTVRKNNVNGRVLLSCELNELKLVHPKKCYLIPKLNIYSIMLYLGSTHDFRGLGNVQKCNYFAPRIRIAPKSESVQSLVSNKCAGSGYGQQ